MKTRKLIALLIVCIFIATGCASTVSKSQYPIFLRSQPDQADISIVDETGKTFYKGKTPTTITLEAGAGFFKGKNYTVTFSKEGYPKRTAEIKRGIDTWYILGNIFLGGYSLIGWLIVDPATGAMWTLQKDVFVDWPTEEPVTEEPATEEDKLEDEFTHNNSATDGAFTIVQLEDVPHHLRDRMVRVR